MKFWFSSAGLVPAARRVSYAWPLALAVSTVAGTLVTACMMPFVAIAVMSAATLPLRRAFATVGAAWAANQLLGFTLLGYPATAYAFGWGGALVLASFAAMLTARTILEPQTLTLVRIIAAFLVAVAVDETLLFGYALIAGGTSTFTPSIVMQLVINDGAWCAILAGCHIALTGFAPKVFGAAPKLRLA